MSADSVRPRASRRRQTASKWASSSLRERDAALDELAPVGVVRHEGHRGRGRLALAGGVVEEERVEVCEDRGEPALGGSAPGAAPPAARYPPLTAGRMAISLPSGTRVARPAASRMLSAPDEDVDVGPHGAGLVEDAVARGRDARGRAAAAPRPRSRAPRGRRGSRRPRRAGAAPARGRRRSCRAAAPRGTRLAGGLAGGRLEHRRLDADDGRQPSRTSSQERPSSREA